MLKIMAKKLVPVDICQSNFKTGNYSSKTTPVKAYKKG